MTFAVYTVEFLSVSTEAERGNAVFPGRFAFYDFTSILVILLLMPAVARITSYGAPGVHSWRRVLAVHLGGLLAFSAAHVTAMVLLRKLFAPIIFGEGYTFSDDLSRDFVYELRKDALTYFILVLFLVLGREFAQKDRALAQAKASAAPRMLTFRSGGRTVMLAASDIRWAKAEGNYAEIHSARGRHFVRTTLKAIEDDLAEAGARAVRIHRSYIAVPSAIVEAAPTGKGDLTLTMVDGAEIPVSRRYRDGLELG